ncbi:TlpA disulfide reductase family protein [Runella aurantiaca]|uniref:AhpC/TSA family protein n=1 Tax=Runella aurantiaca TaxID=2282308 RepID=A0A369I5E2_9BACT|nr:TlpA disulfide reductase family protein [Runella aurantiaca]RDB04939.1 AhpC/TSA family protein [Runella aurantiaca]
MKNILTAAAFFTSVTLFAQTTAKDFTISGTAKNLQPNDKVYLEIAGTQPLVRIDSSKVGPDKRFTFKRKELDEGTVYQLNLANAQRVIVLIEGGETIEITADGTEKGASKVSGSQNNDYYQQLIGMYKEMNEKSQKWQEEYAQAEQKKDSKKIAKIQQDFEAASQGFTGKVKSMIPEMGTSLVALFATNFLNPEVDFATIDALAKRFEAERPTMKQAQVFVGNAKRMRGIQIGDAAPEITLNSTQDKPVSLSSLKGKIVLIDFWASWCGPCRQENPNVVRVYNRFKDKGFEIFSVSLDRDKAAWLKAIEKDGLIWPSHVSDLKYWQSIAAQTYGVNAIPATFLLDKDGKVIDKNLRGAALEKKLEELLKVNN